MLLLNPNREELVPDTYKQKVVLSAPMGEYALVQFAVAQKALLAGLKWVHPVVRDRHVSHVAVLVEKLQQKAGAVGGAGLGGSSRGGAGVSGSSAGAAAAAAAAALDRMRQARGMAELMRDSRLIKDICRQQNREEAAAKAQQRAEARAAKAATAPQSAAVGAGAKSGGVRGGSELSASLTTVTMSASGRSRRTAAMRAEEAIAATSAMYYNAAGAGGVAAEEEEEGEDAAAKFATPAPRTRRPPSNFTPSYSGRPVKRRCPGGRGAARAVVGDSNDGLASDGGAAAGSQLVLGPKREKAPWEQHQEVQQHLEAVQELLQQMSRGSSGRGGGRGYAVVLGYAEQALMALNKMQQQAERH